MDAQASVEQTAALVALVQCLVRLEALEGYAPAALLHAQEVLDENRFLAARDGVDAALIDPDRECRVPVARARRCRCSSACAPHAAELGCEEELAPRADCCSRRAAPSASGGSPARTTTSARLVARARRRVRAPCPRRGV